MVRRALRSRSLRKVAVKTPANKSKRVYKRRKPQKAKCSKCGELLKGVPRERPYKMQTMAISKKRPTRAYGGTLCSKCTKLTIKKKVRAKK